MTPDLVEAVIEHIDLLRRCGRLAGPESYLAQSTNGGQMSRQRAGEIVRDAAHGNGHLRWPHRGTLNWSHPALVVGVCS